MTDRSPVITFLSDYGLGDDFVGICHGVIASICPQARVIDLTHGLRRHDVRAGALLLAGALRYVPAGVHLAVVDPDVGASRRAVALELGNGRTLVGPDNGLLAPAAEAGGGIVQAVDIAQSRVRLEPVSATFHGRDIFAPVAAHAAAGAALGELGTPIDAAELVSLELPRARLEHDAIIAHAIYIDRFGNVQLDADHAEVAAVGLKLGRPVELRLAGGRVHRCHYVRTFADAPSGELLIYQDAYRRLAVAVSHGSAAQRLALAIDDELQIKPA